jgi:U4/U6 small nuclear ribonucleoprotein PRP3
MAEWWDAPLLPTGRYSDLDEFDPAYLKIRTENSPITIYIQHPIPIPAPGDKNKPPPKPLMLTKKVRVNVDFRKWSHLITTTCRSKRR